MSRAPCHSIQLLMLCCVLLTLVGGVLHGQEPSLAPLSKKFEEFRRTGESTELLQLERDPRLGALPSPADWSHYTSTALLQAEPAALPASYDLRALGKLTAIRNQGTCGACWSFAAMGSLESALLPSVTADYSENNLKNLHGFEYTCCYGGNRDMAAAYFSRWSGPVMETQDPYNASSCSSSTFAPARHLQSAYYIPSRSGSLDNDAIKTAVMNYGAVYTNYFHDDTHYNSTTKSYYYNAGTGSNHAVCIVGWNDNYDRTKFKTLPPGNGAFIIRNSWGTWWGESGYFYISYYDTSLGMDDNGVFLPSAPSLYSRVYHYDTFGRTGGSGYGGNTAWCGNVYTAQAAERIMAAGVYTAAAGSSYEMYVYRNPTNGPKGQQAYYRSGTLSHAGFHTIAVGEPVQLTAGQKFSVVFKLTTPGYNYPIPMERPISGYANATAANGQSYMSANGNSWTDIHNSYANSNACIKVYTLEPVASMSVSPGDNINASGPIGGPFANSSRIYTVQNTGNLQMDWTATKLQPWVTVSPASGSLAPGASASVTVYISGATSLFDGSYGDTVSFTNTTSGVGNTSRTVNLTVTDSSISISQAKARANGSVVALKNKVVSAVFGDAFYVQEPDGASGIRVWTPLQVSVQIGEAVNVVGSMQSFYPDGLHATERMIHAYSIVPAN